LVRDREAALARGFHGEQLVEGQLEDPASLESAVTGVGGVVHLAGRLVAPDAAAFAEANHHGTRHLVAAIAARAPEARLVHVSSLAAAGPSVDGVGTGDPPDRCRPCSLYGESKRMGECAVAQSALSEWVILRPPAIYGAHDTATRLLFRQARGVVTAVPWPARPLSILHVRDLLVAIERALEGVANRRIVPLEGPDRTTTSDLMRRMAGACGRKARLVPVPVAVARAAAWGADGWNRVWRRSSFFNRDKMREVSAVGWVADGALGRTILDFDPRVGLDRGLREVAVEEGLVV